MDGNEDTTARGQRIKVTSPALPIILSLVAVLISGVSLYYSAFHVEPKLMVLVPSVSINGELDRCEDENQSGKCLKFTMAFETILINDGNRPTTLTGIKMVVSNPSRGGKNHIV
jgi:hypothetical protein